MIFWLFYPLMAFFCGNLPCHSVQHLLQKIRHIILGERHTDFLNLSAANRKVLKGDTKVNGDNSSMDMSSIWKEQHSIQQSLPKSPFPLTHHTGFECITSISLIRLLPKQIIQSIGTWRGNQLSKDSIAFSVKICSLLLILKSTLHLQHLHWHRLHHRNGND